MKKIRVRWIIQAVCLVLVWCLKLFPNGGEWYATTITLYAPADSLVFLRGFLFLSMIGLFMGV